MRPPAILFALSGLACAGRVLPQEPLFSPRVFAETDHQLPSGLRVVVHEDHSVPLVTVAAIYGAGATADPQEAAGLAHLVEHLTFRARAGEATRADLLKRAGATFNAMTDADTTLYYSVGHRDVLEELVREEVSRLTAPLEGVTVEDFTAERRVVVNERRQRLGGTTGPAEIGILQQRLFPATHPLGRSLMGTEASLARTTLPLAQSFVARHYRPENCTLVIAGDVQAPRVKELIRDWPAALVKVEGAAVSHRPPLLEGPKPAPPAAPETRLLRMTGPVKTSHLMLAWSLPGATPENEAQLWTIAAVLEATSGEHTEASLVPYADGSILIIDRPLGPVEDPQRARARVLDRVVSDEAVRLAMEATPIVRSKARVAWLRQLADPVAYALQLTRHVATTGRLSFQSDTLTYMRATTMDAVARTMRTYVQRDRAVALVVDPEGVVMSEPSDVEAHELGRSSGASLGSMGAADILRVARPPGLGALPRFTLANGLKVVALERPLAVLAQIDLFLPGGSATDVPYANLVTALSEDDCRPMDALRNVGGTSRIDHGPFASRVSVVVPDGNLVNGLAALKEETSCHHLSYPLFFAVQGALPRIHRRHLADEQADRVFREALYPAHPYGRSGGELSLEGVHVEEASAYVRSHFRPNDSLGVVTSALSPAALKPLMEEFLEGWQPSAVTFGPRAALPPPISRSRLIRLFPATRRSQVHVRLGCRLPVDANALPALDVVERVVDAQANELRDAWGATYGLDVDLGFFPGSAHLTIEGDVDANQAGNAVARLLALLAGDASNGPDAATFTVARWEVARSFNRRFATTSGITSALLFATQQGWSPAEWDRYPARLAALDAARVQLLMKTCAGHEVVTVMGDIPTLTEQLRAAGLN